MNIENLKKLVNSSLYEDHMIAIEFLKKMSHEEIIQVLPKTDGGWYKSDPIVCADNHDNETDFYICLGNGRYIAYNNTIWYVPRNARNPKTWEYKLKKNE